MKRVIRAAVTFSLLTVAILPFARTAQASKSTCDGIVDCFNSDDCMDFITDDTFNALVKYYNVNC